MFIQNFLLNYSKEYKNSQFNNHSVFTVFRKLKFFVMKICCNVSYKIKYIRLINGVKLLSTKIHQSMCSIHKITDLFLDISYALWKSKHSMDHFDNDYFSNFKVQLQNMWEKNNEEKTCANLRKINKSIRQFQKAKRGMQTSIM